MIDIDVVRQYNEELRASKEKASMLTAQVELYKKELTSKCAELTKELGITVTEDNLEQVYADYEAKLVQSLETGRAVLQKIAQGSVQANVEATANIPGMQNSNQSIAGQTIPAYQQNMPFGSVGGAGIPVMTPTQQMPNMAMTAGMPITNL